MSFARENYSPAPPDDKIFKRRTMAGAVINTLQTVPPGGGEVTHRNLFDKLSVTEVDVATRRAC